MYSTVEVEGVKVPKLVTVPPSSNRPDPEKVTLPPVASKLPLASYFPVDNVKVPSISEAPATVVVVVPISYVQPLFNVSDPEEEETIINLQSENK